MSVLYLYNVATNKEVLLTVRISENVRDEFKKAAELRGASMSGLLHQYIVRTIREEKDTSSHSFDVAEYEHPVNTLSQHRQTLAVLKEKAK